MNALLILGAVLLAGLIWFTIVGIISIIKRKMFLHDMSFLITSIIGFATNADVWIHDVKHGREMDMEEYLECADFWEKTFADDTIYDILEIGCPVVFTGLCWQPVYSAVHWFVKISETVGIIDKINTILQDKMKDLKESDEDKFSDVDINQFKIEVSSGPLEVDSINFE